MFEHDGIYLFRCRIYNSGFYYLEISSRQVEEGKEMERTEIGKELHDNVNQLLGASRLYIDMAKRDGKGRKMYLDRCSEYTLTAIEEIQKLSKALTSDSIKDLGLCEGIRNLCRDMMEVNALNISCAFETFKENSVNNHFKLNIFPIVQEQLNNVIKHAKATAVTILLFQNKNRIKLSMSDNGIGFTDNKKVKGIGISNIKSRAIHFDGTATFVSSAGLGCKLTVNIPVTDKLSP